MKNEDFVKKTQDAINDKVIPAAREGLDKTVETAQDLFEKGKEFVSDMIKEAGKKTETVGEKASELLSEAEGKAEELKKSAGEKAEELKKTAGTKAEELKKTAGVKAEELKKTAGTKADELKHDAAGLFKKADKTVETKTEEIVDFASEKTDQASGVINSGKEGITVAKSNTGKKIAGVALATAAAAGAYALYQKKKAKDEQIKAEFSEKMKKWNELNGEDLSTAKAEEQHVMNVRPGKVYNIGKNALLGEDIVVNIAPIDKEIVFNPEEISEPINPVEELRRRAGEVAKAAGIKAKELSATVGEKAGELKDNLEKKAQEARAAAKEKSEELKDKFDEVADQAEDVQEDLADKAGDLQENLAETVDEVKDTVEETIEEVKDNVSDIIENKMESDGNEPVDDLIEKGAEIVEEKVEDLKDGFEDFKDDIEWEEDESVLVQKGEELKQKAQEKLEDFKEKFHHVKDTVTDKVETMKRDREKLEEPELTYVEEYNVTIHNKGNKDYFFSPMLIQRYNSKKRQTVPTPFHEDGTTLEQQIIKPGETYSGKLFINKSVTDDALIMFEDMLMRSSVAILLEDELDDEFIKDEKADLIDELLFEGEEDYTIFEDEADK